MKKLAILSAGILAIPVVALAVPVPKVTICHATSSESNPYTRIVVSENAIGGHFDNPGTPKAGHEDDILLQGEVLCPIPEGETPTTPQTTTTPEKPSTPSAQSSEYDNVRGK